MLIIIDPMDLQQTKLEKGDEMNLTGGYFGEFTNLIFTTKLMKQQKLHLFLITLTILALQALQKWHLNI